MLSRVSSFGLNAVRSVSRRQFSAAATSSLKDRVNSLVPQIRSDLKTTKEKYGDIKLGEITVGQVIGGMRGMTGLLTETSLLDSEEGIRFRGYTIPELQAKLPKAVGGEEPLPEALLWLLLTGDVPTVEQTRQVTADLHARSTIPDSARAAINALPRTLHPMSQLVASVAILQGESKFAAAYQKGVPKQTYYEYILEDSLDLIARLPEVAAIIYRNVYHGGKQIKADKSLDYSANFAHMLGFDDSKFYELMRLYLTIHADHEGGNVSAHTTHLVGSALTDPYLSYGAGMAGLAGPLHGLANQEVLRWLKEFKKQFGNEEITKERLTAACWKTLKEGRVIPGYGHAVLRKTDPRYTCQREFALKHLPNDPMVKLVSKLYEVVPGVLTEHGKTANPWPNVDAHSGVLLQFYGLTEDNYYTVLFGVSRAFGVLSSLVMSRIQGLPIEQSWTGFAPFSPSTTPSNDGDYDEEEEEVSGIGTAVDGVGDGDDQPSPAYPIFRKFFAVPSAWKSDPVMKALFSYTYSRGQETAAIKFVKSQLKLKGYQEEKNQTLLHDYLAEMISDILHSFSIPFITQNMITVDSPLSNLLGGTPDFIIKTKSLSPHKIFVMDVYTGVKDAAKEKSKYRKSAAIMSYCEITPDTFCSTLSDWYKEHINQEPVKFQRALQMLSEHYRLLKLEWAYWMTCFRLQKIIKNDTHNASSKLSYMLKESKSVDANAEFLSDLQKWARTLTEASDF